MSSLETRVELYITGSLPGQPLSRHVGTSYLINDLWKEIKRLRSVIKGAEIALTRDEDTDAAIKILIASQDGLQGLPK